MSMDEGEYAMCRNCERKFVYIVVDSYSDYEGGGGQLIEVFSKQEDGIEYAKKLAKDLEIEMSKSCGRQLVFKEAGSDEKVIFELQHLTDGECRYITVEKWEVK